MRRVPTGGGKAGTDGRVAPVSVGACGGSGSGAVAPGYLGRIVPAVRRRLEERKLELPQARLEVLARTRTAVPGGTGPGLQGAPGATAEALQGQTPLKDGGPSNGRVSFASAICPSRDPCISHPCVSLIAEVKRCSPSKGPIRPDLEAGALAAAYEAAGARAVSVLTEQDFFSGSLDDLRAAVAHTRLPVLRKDFIIDPYQVYEAAVFGAAAVLLIAALLSDQELHSLAALARELDLDVLVEVHDELELERALRMDEVLIGINNRDLRTFSVSLETTVRLAGLVPAGRVLVSESGIRDHGDVERVGSCGVDAVLVGESILRSSDVGAAIQALMQSAPRVGPRPLQPGF